MQEMLSSSIKVKKGNKLFQETLNIIIDDSWSLKLEYTDTIIMIPARLGSSRLPNKPLLKINGIPLIIHAYNCAKTQN